MKSLWVVFEYRMINQQIFLIYLLNDEIWQNLVINVSKISTPTLVFFMNM